MDIASYLDTLLLLMVTVAAIKDLESRRIPNLLLLTGVLGALVLHLLSAQPLAALTVALSGFAVGLAVMLPFYLLRGMAAGDVKMMAAVGAFTGPDDALRIAIFTWCAGGVMALAVIIAKGRIRQLLVNLWTMLRPVLLRLQRVPAPGPNSQTSVGSIPYALAIAAGTIVHLVARYGAAPLG